MQTRRQTRNLSDGKVQRKGRGRGRGVAGKDDERVRRGRSRRRKYGKESEDASLDYEPDSSTEDEDDEESLHSPLPTPTRSRPTRSRPTPSRSRRKPKAAVSQQSDDESVLFEESFQSAVKNTPITKSYLRMMPSAVPADLPCREKETNRVVRHLADAIRTGSTGACLYLSGMPGTGKTATVSSAIQKLRDMRLQFDLVEVNAMRVPNPAAVYQVLYRLILNKKRAPNALQAYSELDKRFNTRDIKRKVCVLIVDEIDGLMTKTQTVLYTLFDWPTLPHSRLAVVAIANTMNLPERMISRCKSRLGCDRVDFYAYTKDQIFEILKKRLPTERQTAAEEETSLPFADPALEWCARKVSSTFGDIRQALQIARAALEHAHRKGDSQVELQNVVEVWKNCHLTEASPVIRELPYIQKLFVLVIILETRRLPSDDFDGLVPMRQVHERLTTVTSSTGVFGATVYISMSQIYLIAAKLVAIEVIEVAPYTPLTADVAKRRKVAAEIDKEGGDVAVRLIPPLGVAETALSSEKEFEKYLL